MKAQATNQIFIYIMSILVIGLLLFFGIKWIGQLINSGSDIDDTKFKIELENRFDSTRTKYGSSYTYTFHAPSGSDVICIVDNIRNPISLNTDPICSPSGDFYDLDMCNSWKDNDSAVLASPPLSVEVDVGSVEVKGSSTDPNADCLCFKVASFKNFDLRLTGLGDKVKVKDQ